MSEPQTTMTQGYVALLHSNPVLVEGGSLRVDRKFHLGMLRYAARMKSRCWTLNPQLQPGERIMDEIEVPIAGLPYQVDGIQVDGKGKLSTEGLTKLRNIIGGARLTYGGGMQAYWIARELHVPFVSIQECDLDTQIQVTMGGVDGVVRKAVRAVKCFWSFRTHVLKEISGADAVHCNGFPVYNVARRHNPHSMLYLDSRMSEEMVVSADELEARIASLPGRRLRLLFSGRYDIIKGAVDVIEVGVECLRRGLDIELHCYGQGNLKSRMEQVASTAAVPGRIFIHDAIPYPDLVKLSRTFDLFVCCHVQSDPSCTYLESMGAGLPIVGYDNRMWRGLNNASGVGCSSPLGNPAKVSDDIERLARDPATLGAMARKAAEFARQHCFEIESDKRIDAINAMLVKQ